MPCFDHRGITSKCHKVNSNLEVGTEEEEEGAEEAEEEEGAREEAGVEVAWPLDCRRLCWLK